MPAIAFPVQSAPGPYPQESAGRLLNAMSGVTQEGAGSINIIRRVPGLLAAFDAGFTGPRGFISVGGTLFGAYSGVLVKRVGTGPCEFVGTLPGDGPVYFAANNRTPVPDIIAVTDTGAFIITSTSVSDYNDADLPQPNSACYQGGYFFFSIADGRMFASGLNATTISALDTARTEQRPGTLLRVLPVGRQLFAMKTTSIEVWSNTGEATGFPFSFGDVIDRGLIAPRAVAGVQDGFATQLLWVGDDGAVHALDGYSARPISTPDVERSIGSLADKTQLRADVYMTEGTPMFVLSAPGWSWEFDLRLARWHERASYGISRWRGQETVYSGGKWLCGDVSSSKVHEITREAFSEDGDPLVFTVESIQMGSFPRSFRVGETRFDFSFGTGLANGIDPIETDPVALISWSDDAGTSWSNQIPCALGRQGAGTQRITLPRQLGRTGPKGRRWKILISDPVRVGLLGADMTVMEGR